MARRLIPARNALAVVAQLVSLWDRCRSDGFPPFSLVTLSLSVVCARFDLAKPIPKMSGTRTRLRSTAARKACNSSSFSRTSSTVNHLSFPFIDYCRSGGCPVSMPVSIPLSRTRFPSFRLFVVVRSVVSPPAYEARAYTLAPLDSVVVMHLKLTLPRV